ncbi:MAG TPA: Ig-like domain-containing protein, partial [Acidimicrobiales bacterium]
NVVMSREDDGDRGNSPALNCLFQNGQEGAVTDGPTPVTVGGGSVGGTQMNASVNGTTLTAQWDQLAYDRCVNVYSNNGYYGGMTLSFDQTVTSLGVVPVQPVWTDGQVRLERKDGSHVIHWGTDADTNLTIPAALRPTAVADSGIVDATYAGQGASSVSVDVLANDSGVGPLKVASIAPTVAGGTLDCGALPGPGPCAYTPPVGYSGTDTANITVSDDNGSATASLTIVVKPNAAPIAQDDQASTTIATAVHGTVAANDRDPDADPLTVTTTPVTGPAHGSVTLAADGSYDYTPAAGFFGADSFTYEVCDRHPMLSGPPTSRCAAAKVSIEVGAGRLPAAVGDEGITDEGVALTIPVLDNDTAGDAGPLEITFAGTGTSAGTTIAGGTVACTTTCTYTPADGYSGPDAFTYTVTDAAGRPSSATVAIVVRGNHAPVAGTDTIVAAQDGPAVSADLAANDVELDRETLVFDPTPATAPTKGTVVIAADGSAQYTPNAGASGTDAFAYKVCDDHELVDGSAAPKCATGTVNVTISATPKLAPVAVEDGLITDTDIGGTVDVTANDHDPDGTDAGLTISYAGFAGAAGTTQAGGTVTCSATCRYAPPAGFSGTDVFRYTVTDADGLTASAVVVVDVRGNHPPVAADDLGITPANMVLHGDLSANDDEIDGEGLVYDSTPVEAPRHGTVTISPDGRVVYTPYSGYAGGDSFVYKVCDDHKLVDGTPAPLCSQAVADILVGVATVNDVHDAVESASLNRPGGAGTGSVSAHHDSLARTGADLAPLALAGTLLIALGWFSLHFRRRVPVRRH